MGTNELGTYLAEHPHKGFSGQPHYYANGDYLTFFAKDERCHAVRVNELLTIYVSATDESLVGCKVKGVLRVMQQLKEMHIRVSDSDIKLGLFFVSVAAITEEADSRTDVLKFAKQIPETSIPKEVLPQALAA